MLAGLPWDQAEADCLILGFKVTQDFWVSEDPARVDQYQLLC